MRGLTFRFALCLSVVLTAGAVLPSPAGAGEAEDAYIATRNRHVTAIAAAMKSGIPDQKLYKMDEQARVDLKKRLSSVLGPLSFKGVGRTPTFSPGALYSGEMESGRPDGLLFQDEAGTTRIFVSTVPILTNWVGEDAKSYGREAPSLVSQLSEDGFLTNAVSSDAAFISYMQLQLAAQEGETVVALLGLFAQDDPSDVPPRSLVVARLAKDRVMVATIEAPSAAKEIPACTKVWGDYQTKANQLFAAIPKGRGADDPKWDEAQTALSDGGIAYRKCYADEAPKQSFYPGVMKRAEGLLATMRGK
ncbi:hypothetical protein [Azorhizobium doebereinerae]|uniref:hypothetical protein n=1 Tax=Azorhizobium doebereinerae TaxID=281091 RepID=UPI00048EC7DA|nr:hypothetical protein [Azorhizobium doebereinerae]